nr:protein kinase-like domain, concanavalin A-like lectin/glucanase domain protein [Tanacetum cinerariifolium]
MFYDHVNPVTRRTIDQSAVGKLRDRNAKESWALFEELTLYENKSWNDPSGPHDTQYCMEDPEQAFVEYASSRTDETGGNFIYVIDFMIVKDISSIIDPRMSQVVLGRPFVEISNMTHDPPEEREHKKWVYLRNEEDNERGVEYVMSKILGFYKDCLELGPEYATRTDDEEEVTLYLIGRSLEILRKFHWMILGGRFNQLSHVSSQLLSKPGEY